MNGHSFEYDESGRYMRVACSCGWVGEWRLRERRDIQRALHSDENVHYFTVKRQEAAR